MESSDEILNFTLLFLYHHCQRFILPAFLSPNKSILFPTEKDFLEVSRYLGYKRIQAPDENIKKLIEECSLEMFNILMPKSTYEIFDLTLHHENEIIFADLKIKSENLSKNLKNCTKVAILAATIGSQVDNLIRRYEKIDTVKASIMQSAGAMYIEKLVDFTSDEIKKIAESSNLSIRPRFSPGFGDVSLEIQKDFFRLLPCQKIGLTLMNTLIMAPEKSVTAFIGF